MYAFLIILFVISIVPFYMMIINSTRSNTEISQGIYLLPGDQLKANYDIILKKVNIWRGFISSILIAVPAVALSALLLGPDGLRICQVQFQIQGNPVLAGTWNHDDTPAAGTDRIL